MHVNVCPFLRNRLIIFILISTVLMLNYLRTVCNCVSDVRLYLAII